MLMMMVSMDQYKITVNPTVNFFRARVKSAGFVVHIVVRSCGVKFTFYVEEYRSLGGYIFIRLDNGAFVGLI